MTETKTQLETSYTFYFRITDKKLLPPSQGAKIDFKEERPITKTQ